MSRSPRAVRRRVDYFPRFAVAAALTSLEHRYALMLVADPTVSGAPVTACACDGIVGTDRIGCSITWILVRESTASASRGGRRTRD